MKQTKCFIVYLSQAGFLSRVLLFWPEHQRVFITCLESTISATQPVPA